MTHTVMLEDEQGNRKVMPNITEMSASALINSGKFIARLRTDRMTVLRAAGKFKSQPEQRLHYGGRKTPKNPNGYRGG